ncbi:MAG: hypothetical protein GY869_22505, partial [Planctomycetes bacterium]|nr:hypothetical protein [Planctomycetota bacterium]
MNLYRSSGKLVVAVLLVCGFSVVARGGTQDVTEIDQHPLSYGLLELTIAGVGTEIIVVEGSTEIHVYLEGSHEGDADDDDSNGRDEVDAAIMGLNLGGVSSVGAVQIRMHPTIPSRGMYEEQANINAGLLEVDPFAPGDADSFFDVFFQVTIGSQLYNTDRPLRLSGLALNKPMQAGEYFSSLSPVQLMLPTGEPSGHEMNLVRYYPSHLVVEHDVFNSSLGGFLLLDPGGGTEAIEIAGTSRMDVFFEGPIEGYALDDTGNGLEEVETELIALSMAGNSSMGPISVSLHGNNISRGVIEEQANMTGKLLELDPFAPGNADSFLDVFVEISIPNLGVTLHNEIPIHLSGEISHKPP